MEYQRSYSSSQAIGDVFGGDTEQYGNGGLVGDFLLGAEAEDLYALIKLFGLKDRQAEKEKKEKRREKERREGQDNVKKMDFSLHCLDSM